MEVMLNLENQFNEGFLRRVSGANKTGPVSLSRSTSIGKFINAMVRYSDTPPKQTIGTKLLLPETPVCTGRNKFCYLTIEDQSKINDYISATLTNWFDRVLIEGIYKLGLDRRTITEVIISELNLVENAELESKIYERIKKYEYRQRMRAKKNLVASLQNYEL